MLSFGWNWCSVPSKFFGQVAVSKFFKTIVLNAEKIHLYALNFVPIQLALLKYTKVIFPQVCRRFQKLCNLSYCQKLFALDPTNC